MNAGELMRSDILTLGRDSTLAEIYAVMTQYQQTDFPVVDADLHLVGMLYEENILKPLFAEFRKRGGEPPNYAEFKSIMRDSPFSGIRAEQIMIAGEIGIPLDLDLVKAGAIMSARKVRQLVVTADERVAGMISGSAIFLHLMKVAGTERVGSGRPEMQQPPAEKKQIAAGERRRFSRHRADFKVVFEFSDTTGKALAGSGHFCTCLNVSMGGMMLQTDVLLELRQLIVLAFEIPQLGLPVRRLARVSRVSTCRTDGRYEVGLMFLALSVDESAAIEKLLNILKSSGGSA